MAHIPPLIPSSSINNISKSLVSFNFIPECFKQACHASPGNDKKQAGSNL